MTRLLPFARALLLAAAACLPFAPAAQAQDKNKKTLSAAEKEAERNARLKLAEEALEKLYKVRPEARKSVEGAAGYAVFDITSIYAILFVGQKGHGVLFNNATKKPTFMTSNRAGTGPGVGKQRVFQVFVFKTKDAMGQFLLTGGMGGDISGSVSTGSEGTVLSFNPSIDIYQIPASGMAVQASWGGTVYSVDKDLN
jgi:lipid-binding SYLF domain-containing protein